MAGQLYATEIFQNAQNEKLQSQITSNENNKDIEMNDVNHPNVNNSNVVEKDKDNEIDHQNVNNMNSDRIECDS